MSQIDPQERQRGPMVTRVAFVLAIALIGLVGLALYAGKRVATGTAPVPDVAVGHDLKTSVSFTLGYLSVRIVPERTIYGLEVHVVAQLSDGSVVSLSGCQSSVGKLVAHHDVTCLLAPDSSRGWVAVDSFATLAKYFDGSGEMYNEVNCYKYNSRSAAVKNAELWQELGPALRALGQFENGSTLRCGG